MRILSQFVSGLLLSALLLLPTPVHAAEVQPFLTLKTSGVNTLLRTADKIGTMAGVADTAEFKQAVTTVKGAKGFDFDGIIGLAATVDNDGGLSPILLLPVTDLWKIEIPGNPEFFDTIRPFLTKKGDDRTEINLLMMGTFIALQKQGYLVIAPEGVIDQLPADPRTLFADLEKYTLGAKIDLEKIKIETIEEQIFGPLLFMAMMQSPDAAEQIESVIELVRQFYGEFAMLSEGIVFDSQTADVAYSNVLVPRKGSDLAKSLAGYERQPSIFGGFCGVPENVIVSLSTSSTQTPASQALIELGTKQWETILEGLLEQVEMEDESGEITELVKKIVASVQKIIETESKRGAYDVAFSLNMDGTLLLACDTGSLAEIQELAVMLAEFGNQRIAPMAAMFDIDVNALVRRDYLTVEGFKVSSFTLPMDKIAPLSGADIPKDWTPAVFWAVREAGGKQAMAVAAGLDAAKTEQAFKSALEQTKTPMPVRKPMGTLSVQGLGKFLQQTVSPIAEKANVPNFTEARKVFDILAASGNDATITMDVDMKPDRVESAIHISGKVIQAVATAIQSASTAASTRQAIQDF